MARDAWPRAAPLIRVGPGEATRLVRALPGAPVVVTVTPLEGGLGNTNLRLDLADGRAPLVLRLYQHGAAEAAKERTLHAPGMLAGVPLPRLWVGGNDNPVTGTHYAVLDWIEGRRLDEIAAALGDRDRAALGAAVGAVLARIHGKTFDRAGLLGPALDVVEPVGLGGAGLVDYLRRCLVEERGGDCLGAALTERVLDFAAAEGGLLDTWDGPPCLAHGDFGGSNILIRDGAVAAVLDWEFAFSGTPFVDLGNLLRPPLGTLPGFADGVERGYRSAGGRLPQRWHDMALLTDLTSWAEFMTRPVVPAAIVATAQEHVTATMAGWR